METAAGGDGGGSGGGLPLARSLYLFLEELCFTSEGVVKLTVFSVVLLVVWRIFGPPEEDTREKELREAWQKHGTRFGAAHIGQRMKDDDGNWGKWSNEEKRKRGEIMAALDARGRENEVTWRKQQTDADREEAEPNSGPHDQTHVDNDQGVAADDAEDAENEQKKER